MQTALGRSVARTVGYAPPEVVGKPKGNVWVGPHSDVYAFGKLAAFALTGRPDPDGGDLVILPEPWKQQLDDLTGWTIRARLPHFAAVMDRLGQLPGRENASPPSSATCTNRRSPTTPPPWPPTPRISPLL